MLEVASFEDPVIRKESINSKMIQDSHEKTEVIPKWIYFRFINDSKLLYVIKMEELGMELNI